jgi:hypothetical protein
LTSFSKRWKWQIIGRQGDVLAESPDLSEAECENAIREMQAAFKAGNAVEVEETTRSQ